MKEKLLNVSNPNLLKNTIKNYYREIPNIDETKQIDIKFIDDLITIEYDNPEDLFSLAYYFLDNLDVDDLVYEELVNRSYYVTLICIEIDRFFLFNTTLNEQSFIKFNLSGLKKEINIINKNLLELNGINSYKEELFKTYNKIGLEISDYANLTAKYINNELNLINKKGERINIDNIERKLLLHIETADTNIFLIDVYLCSIVCNMLNVSELIITNNEIKLYNQLNKDELLLNTKIVLLKGEN